MMKNALPWSLFAVALVLILVVSGLLLSKPPVKVGRYQVAIIKGSQPDIADTPVKIDTESGQSWLFDGDKWLEIATTNEQAGQLAAEEERARLQMELESLKAKQDAEIAAIKAKQEAEVKSLLVKKEVVKVAPQATRGEVRKVYRRLASSKKKAAVATEKVEAQSGEEGPPPWLND
ncbi:MAG: hypothetical protein WC632_02095 [Candidatus Margulisiibacteriota bacterium]